MTPTILDWFNLSYPTYNMFGKHGTVKIHGKSLLPLLGMYVNVSNYPVFGLYLNVFFIEFAALQSDPSVEEAVFGSHNLHEVTMYYPMRYVRTRRYKLIHNLNYRSTFPIDQDFYLSATFQVV